MAIETQTRIGIVSKALVLIGEKPLISESDDRYGATVGVNLFETIYESQLQSNRWRFAMKKGALSRLNVEPLNEWQYIYQIPSDCLLLIGMTNPQPYEVYGDRVYTNATECEMEYLFKPTPDKIPAYFALLMQYALARDMVKPISEQETMVDRFEKKYVQQRSSAMYADAQARPARTVSHSPFTDGR